MQDRYCPNWQSVDAGWPRLPTGLHPYVHGDDTVTSSSMRMDRPRLQVPNACAVLFACLHCLV